MNNWIGPTVKHVWNIGMHVLHNFSGLSKTQPLATWADIAFISFCWRALYLHSYKIDLLSLTRLPTYVLFTRVKNPTFSSNRLVRSRPSSCLSMDFLIVNSSCEREASRSRCEAIRHSLVHFLSFQNFLKLIHHHRCCVALGFLPSL